MGYLLSSFLWAYVLCLIPVGLLVDRFGGKIVNACGIGLWSLATVCTGLAPSHLFVMVSRDRHGHGRVDLLARVQPHHPRVVPGGGTRLRQRHFRRRRGGGTGGRRGRHLRHRRRLGLALGVHRRRLGRLRLAAAVVGLFRPSRARRVGCVRPSATKSCANGTASSPPMSRNNRHPRCGICCRCAAPGACS